MNSCPSDTKHTRKTKGRVARPLVLCVCFVSEAPEFIPSFSGVRVARPLVLCVCFVSEENYRPVIDKLYHIMLYTSP
jgi:hypothetical protein